MNLFRVHAYAVEPERTKGSSAAPPGGEVRVTDDIHTALGEAARQSRLENRTLVDFRMDTTSRTNDVRDLILRFAFGTASAPAAAALDFARRLGNAMDLRSTACLFVLAAERDGNRRRVTMWTFPRDEAFQFRGRAGGSTIRLLTDVFSRTSRLRKAALWDGQNRRTDFLTGRVLDFQANLTSREVADFWIDRFLECVLALAEEAGTRLLAKALRGAYDLADQPQAREQLYAALASVRHAPQTRWSLREFADRYLQGETKEGFLRSVPNEETLDSSFDFHLETFDKTINFRVFRLDSDVFVSAPFDEIGRSVVVQEQQLRCEGRIVDEKVRARHA